MSQNLCVYDIDYYIVYCPTFNYTSIHKDIPVYIRKVLISLFLNTGALRKTK